MTVDPDTRAAVSIRDVMVGAAIAMALFTVIFFTIVALISVLTSLSASREQYSGGFLSELGFASWVGGTAIAAQMAVTLVVSACIGMPLGLLAALLVRRTTPIAIGVVAYFLVGVATAGVLASLVAAAISSGIGDPLWLELYGNPATLIVLGVTGVCSAVGWLVARLVPERKPSVRHFAPALP